MKDCETSLNPRLPQLLDAECNIEELREPEDKAVYCETRHLCGSAFCLVGMCQIRHWGGFLWDL